MFFHREVGGLRCSDLHKANYTQFGHISVLNSDFEFRISNFEFRTDSSEKSNASVPVLSSCAIFAPTLPWGRLRCFLARAIMHRLTMVPASTRSRRAFGWIDPTVRLVARFLNFKTKKASARSPRGGLEPNLISFDSEPIWLYL